MLTGENLKNYYREKKQSGLAMLEYKTKERTKKERRKRDGK